MSKYGKQSTRVRLAAGLLGAAGMAALLPSSGWAYNFAPVVRQGDHVRGNSVEFMLRAASMDEAGNVTFEASLSSGKNAFFKAQDGTFTVVPAERDGADLTKSAAPEALLSKLVEGQTLVGSDVLQAAPEVVSNSQGVSAFAADITAGQTRNREAGVYVWSQGVLRPIARPGDMMPGGGSLLTASLLPGQVDVNGAGDVAFTATLREQHDGAFDTGLYLYRGGKLSVVARTGTEVPGVGTIERIQSSLVSGWFASGGATLNEAGELAFAAILSDKSVVLLKTGAAAVGEEPEVDALPRTLSLGGATVLGQSSVIRYAMPKSGSMTLRLYSVDGRRVTTLAQGTRAAGRYEAALNAKDIAPGVYFLRLEADGATVNQKVTLVH